MNPAKVDPLLQNRMNTSSLKDGVPVIIRHKGDMFFSQALGDVLGFNLLKATSLEIRSADIDSLSEEDDIDYIWADLPVKTCLNVSVPKIAVPQVWTAGYQGDGIKLAIIDTGIDPSHPDFEGRIKARISFVAGAENDDNGHGTHVAGIAAGANSKYRGVAPGAHLYIAKVLDKNGDGSMSRVMAGIEWAVEQGAQVINLSLGSRGPADGSDALSAMCNAAVTQKGIVVCVAAGNNGPGDSTVGSPGSGRDVITVGATNDNDQIPDFSARGPTADGRIKPDIVFPGFGIVAAQAKGTTLGKTVAPGYTSLDGTSMATPHASGAVCLLLQAKGDLTPTEVKAALRNTATDLRLSGNTQGVGRGDVFKAFESATKVTVPNPPPTPPPTPPAQNKGCLPESIARLLGQ